MIRLRLLVLIQAMVVCLLAAAGASSSDVEMLDQIFRSPRHQWRLRLTADRALLTEEFFVKIEQRIRWSIQHDNQADAIDFALVGDLGSQVANRPSNFRLELAQLLLQAKDYDFALRALDALSPENSSDAQMERALEMQATISRQRSE